MVDLDVQHESFAETALTQKEMELFNAQWKDLFFPSWSLERELINSRRAVVDQGVRAAKNALDERNFGGFNSGANEIGISTIRPGQVGLAGDGSSNEEGDNTWLWTRRNATVPGYNVAYDCWIHSPNTVATAFTLHKDQFVIPLYIVEQSTSPKLQTVKIDIGRSDILYYDCAANQIRDARSGISLYPLPTTFWGPSIDVLISIQAKAAGALELRLGGFCVGLGTFLNASSYEGSTNTIVTYAAACD